MAQLYCQHCCMRQECRKDGQTYTCSFCKCTVQPPAPGHEYACPRSSSGQHNPFREVTGVICSQCGIALPKEEGEAAW